MNQRTILVTGATGFVGKAVVKRLMLAPQFRIRALARQGKRLPSDTVEVAMIDDIASHTDWSAAIDGVDTILHLAARAHVMRETVVDSLAEFLRVNVEGTLHLAGQARKAGVRRFIFISSIGVNGNETHGTAFTEDDAPNPQDEYSTSKLEAETALRVLLAGSSTDLIIIRPPLVYGPNAPGNFGRLHRLVMSGFPLPFGTIHNCRSLVALDNLADMVVTCIDHAVAAGQIFLVSDGEDLSTTELVRRMANSMGRPAHLLPVPASVLLAVGTVLGKRKVVARLCGSLEVDSTKARRMLSWMPPITVDEGLRRINAH